MSEIEKPILCLLCRSAFGENEVQGDCCPNCGNKGLPADLRRAATVTLTEQEWRILCIWASNWAEKVCAKSDDSDINSPATMSAIIREIHRQAPDLARLSMAEEIQELADVTGNPVEVHSDGESKTIEPKKRH